MKKINISKLPSHYLYEKQSFQAINIDSWEQIKNLSEEEINMLIKKYHSSSKNLKALQGIARLICELDVSQPEASLLLQSGVPSSKALAKMRPDKLAQKVAKLYRILNINKAPMIDLKRAKKLIKAANELDIK